MQTYALSVDIFLVRPMSEEVIELERSQFEEPFQDPFFEWYISVATDLIYKATLATVLLFITCPWAAFLWPPYYFLRRDSQ